MRDPHWPEGNSQHQADEPLHGGDDVSVADSDVATTDGIEPIDTDAALVPVAPDGYAPESRSRRMRRLLGRAMLVTGAVIAVLAILYVIDLLVSIGDVPRGTTVAGVDIGGMRRANAEDMLRREAGPHVMAPLIIRAGDVDTVLEPRPSGLGVDWPATVDRAGGQPLNPITRLVSFFRAREVEPVAIVDSERLRDSIRTLATDQINHGVTEGGIGFQQLDGGAVKPVAIEPRQGQKLSDLDSAVSVVEREWLHADVIRLPVSATPTKVDADAVREALNGIVAVMVSAPIQVYGDGDTVELLPSDISAALRFEPDNGELNATLDPEVLERILAPQLRDTESPARDARIVTEDGERVVEPSQPERMIDWDATLGPVDDVASSRSGRELTVEYRMVPPAFTTEDAQRQLAASGGGTAVGGRR